MKPFQPPLAVDLFEQFLGAARPKLLAQDRPKDRLQLLWSFAKSARDLAAHDVWEDAFEALADELGLTAQRHIGRDGIPHVLSWAWRGVDPFE
jgi:hypothetical protein